MCFGRAISWENLNADDVYWTPMANLIADTYLTKILDLDPDHQDVESSSAPTLLKITDVH